jgi:hypothetical protein
MKLDMSPGAVRGGAEAPQVNGRIGEVRRNGWLYSLEHALLDSGSKSAQPKLKNEEADARQSRAVGNAARRGQGSQEAFAGGLLAAMQATQAQAMQGGAIQGYSSGQNAAVKGEAQASAPQGNPAAKADSRNALPSRNASAAKPANDAQPVSGWAWLAANGATAQAAQAGPACTQPKPALRIGTINPIRANAVSAMATEVALNVAATSAMADAASSDAASASAPDATASPPPLLTHDPIATTSRGAAVLQPASNEPYGRQQLHVHVSDKGVQAWVRDADLSAAGASRVADAFLQNAQYGGARLAALTINGKKVIDSVFSRRAMPDSLTHPGTRRSQPGDF